MRPRHPQWSCITEPSMYPERSLLKPCTDIGQVHAVNVGPLELGNSQGSINKRWWLCYQDGSNVYLRGAVDLVYWSAPVLVFNETEAISRLDFTFDQVGRVIVFYQVGTELRLWYFDSLAGEFIKRVIDSSASQPLCGFDLVNNTSDPMSDAALFYVKNDEILERLQRDRYDIVYNTYVGAPGISLVACGMTEGNRFQVEYLTDDDILERKKVYQTAAPVMDNFNNQVFEFGFDIGANYNSKCAERESSGEAVLTLFEHTRSDSLIPDTTINVSLVYPNLAISDLPMLAISSGLLSTPLTYINLTDHFYKGTYRFVFTNPADTTKKRLQFYRNGALVADVQFDKPALNYSATAQHSLKFGAADEGVSTLPTVYWRCTKAQFLNMYCIIDGVRTDWPITAGLPASTASVPPGNSMTVYVDGKDGARFF